MTETKSSQGKAAQMAKEVPTLYDAIAGFLGPLSAEYGRLIAEGSDEMPVEIRLGGYVHKTTLAAIKRMDRAHFASFEDKNRRAEKRARGTLL